MAPPHRPRTHSQTKALANAGIRDIYSPTVSPTPTQPCVDPKNEDKLAPDHLCDSQHNSQPLIVPIIKNLQLQYPLKHEGMLEDPFPLIQSANSVTDPSTGKQLKYKQLINHPECRFRQTWQRSSANEFGQLAQGVSGWIEVTDTIKFLWYHEMPKNRHPTYVHFVCEICPQKTEKERTRLTVGGNLIDYPDTATTRTCNLVTFKMHINSTLS